MTIVNGSTMSVFAELYIFVKKKISSQLERTESSTFENQCKRKIFTELKRK